MQYAGRISRGKDTSSAPEKPLLPPSPLCEKTDTLRIDYSTPTSMVADWGPPFRLGEPVNTLCPQDAIEITRDGAYLCVMYTEDVLDKMSPEQILARHNNTYRLKRIGGPDDFGEPEFYDLSKGTNQSLNGELSFSPDGDTMYYASGRNPLIGMAIYRSVRAGSTWSAPELAIRGLVGEPSLTADGQLLYFVHVLSNAGGNYDADVWCCQRVAK
jgi:hypothetical protein